LLRQGILLSQHFQRTVVNSGISILERPVIKTLKTFRMVVLNGVWGGGGSNQMTSTGTGNLVGEDENAQKLFSSSVAHALRLAWFLADALQVRFESYFFLVFFDFLFNSYCVLYEQI